MDSVKSLTTSDDIKKKLASSFTQDDPDTIEKNAAKELETFEGGAVDAKSSLFKALTLDEFHKGILMSTVIPDHYRTFAIDMSRKLQQEYNCQSVSEKATCEIVTVNFVRVLEIQRKLNSVLELGSTTSNLNQYMAVLSKELDRANRQYQSMLQTLRLMKQIPFQVTVKAQTAVIGQNQLIQSNNSHE